MSSADSNPSASKLPRWMFSHSSCAESSSQAFSSGVSLPASSANQRAFAGVRPAMMFEASTLALSAAVLSRICACLARSEEHTSELQSLMRNSYAVFCLKKKQTDEHKHSSQLH